MWIDQLDIFILEKKASKHMKLFFLSQLCVCVDKTSRHPTPSPQRFSMPEIQAADGGEEDG